MRLSLDRIDRRIDRGDGDGETRYEGKIATPAAEFPVQVAVREGGEVEVVTDAGPDLAEKVRLIVRTVLRHAEGEGQPPPRRIQRWREGALKDPTKA